MVLCTDVLLLNDGKLVESGALSRVAESNDGYLRALVAEAPITLR